VLLLLAPAISAKHIYEYADANGVVHYTDVKPGEDVKEVKSSLVHTDHQPLIRLRQSGSDDDETQIFLNATGGPVSVEIAFETVENDRFPVAQAFSGQASHTDKQNYYAVDVGMPEGTPVLAARDGAVMTVDNDFYGAGQDLSKYGDRAHNIRIVHGDGTMAVYAHLQLESARVAVGDHVHAGQQIALSGNTGYTRGPQSALCRAAERQHGPGRGAVQVHWPEWRVHPRKGNDVAIS